MATLLDRLLNQFRPNADLANVDLSDFDSAIAAARHMSLHPSNRNSVIVLVEIAAEFNYKLGTYGNQQYNFYTYRGRVDFNSIKNLKAAFVNGDRVDDVDRSNSSRLVSHQPPPIFDTPKAVDIDESEPIALGGRRFKPVMPPPRN